MDRSRVIRAGLLGLALTLAAAPVTAGDREALRARLQRLESQEGDLLGALEAMERQAEEEEAAYQAAETRLKDHEGALAEAKRARAETRTALSRALSALGPRLAARYRLGEAGYLPVLLSARDAGDLMRRRKLLDKLVQTDLTQLEEIAALQSRLVEQEAALVRQQEGLVTLRDSARSRLATSQAAREAQRAALAEVRQEAGLKRRALAALQQAQARLGGVVRSLPSGGRTGFGALRGRLGLPVAGAIEQGFGRAVDPTYDTVTVHKGVDIRAPMGAKVRAVGPGKVVHAGWLRGYGNLVILDHGGGWHTLMAHLARMDVQVGDGVEAGEVVGRVGDTGSLKGAYLYFEIREQGQAIDPAPWFSR